MISKFDGNYAFLSNFYECDVMFDGYVFKSSEAAYQAAKCLYIEDRKQFLTLTPSQAKRKGQKVELRPDWEDIKLNVMESILIDKFARNYELAEKLVKTAYSELVEGNTWGDTYWGVCDGKGENHLGELLMKVRSIFLRLFIL